MDNAVDRSSSMGLQSVLDRVLDGPGFRVSLFGGNRHMSLCDILGRGGTKETFEEASRPGSRSQNRPFGFGLIRGLAFANYRLYRKGNCIDPSESLKKRGSPQRL